MAHIDNLIESVKDPQLRAALRSEHDKVTKNRRTGLVFDRHLPESVVLPGFAIREGEKVQVLADGSDDPADLDGSGVWTVTAVDGAQAHLRDGGGDTRQVDSGSLVATRQFGDPIYPGLVSTGRVVRGGGVDGDDGGKPFHTVINAENYHALEALLFAHEGQVDAIYIDPPYNTGARDWKYNNDYVDDADPYRHSKWLSFIERRLLLAKRLLKPSDSVLIVTIDEKEYLRLGLLLEQLFPSSQIHMTTSVISPQGSARPGAFARVEEYIFFVRIGAARVHVTGDDMLIEPESVALAPVWFSMIRSGTDARRQDSKNLFYPIHVRSDTRQVVQVGEPLPVSLDRSAIRPLPGCEIVWPIRRDGSEGRWQLSAATFLSSLEKGYAKVGAINNTGGRSIMYVRTGDRARIERREILRLEDDAWGYPVYERTADGVASRAPKSVWNKLSHDAGKQGTMLLSRLLPGRKFPFPKSLYAVEDALRFFIADKPDALVIDFFAGSGTTAHAVMRINHQLGGRRRSIMVTNNEVSVEEQKALRRLGLRPGDQAWEAEGICEYITKPRIEAAITGRAPGGAVVSGSYSFIAEFEMSEGLDENAEFFTLTYEEPALVSLGRRFEAIAPLLWLRAGSRGVRIDEVSLEGWSIPTAACYGVLFDTSAWGAFVAAAASREDLTHAFIVTDSLVEYQQIVSRLSPALATTRLYADYLRSFEINVRTT